MNIGQNPNKAHKAMKNQELHIDLPAPSRHPARRRAVGSALLAAALFLSPAQSLAQNNKQPAPSKELQDEARKVLKPNNAPPSKDAKDQSQTSGKWCIALASLRGPERDEATPVALDRIRTKGQLPNAYADRRANATIIAYGQYDSPDDPQAVADLKRIREIQVDGQSPYIFAILSPPAEANKIGNLPEYNLVQAKRLFGEDALQSLQVAVYGRDDLKNPTEKDLQECRAKAEEYCTQLRREGEVAFYYHGTRRSMVTIGVFDITDYDPQLPTFNSQRLAELKKRHPYNLYNGAAIREKRPGQKEGRLQPSTLVKIPDPPAETPGATQNPPAKIPSPLR